jgi:predicted nucleotide-binding protein
VATLKVAVTEASNRIGRQTQAGLDLGRRTTDLTTDAGAAKWRADYVRWCQVTETMLTATYEDEDALRQFQGAIAVRHIIAIERSALEQAHQDYERLTRAINVLQGLQEGLVYVQGPDAPAFSAALDEGIIVTEKGPASIFVVHGHSETLRHLVVRVIERSTGVDVTILGEEEVAGLTVLEKFEQFAGAADFAVVLLTADDRGGPAGENIWKDRGRQNVVFEMGWFFGHLGRDRVAVIYDETVELPSDLNGLAYIPNDPGGVWKQRLGKQLQNAGFGVDYSRMP